MAASLFHGRERDPAGDAALVATDARDDLVLAALALAGTVRADVTDERVADDLVAVVIAAESYVVARRRLTALLAEREEVTS